MISGVNRLQMVFGLIKRSHKCNHLFNQRLNVVTKRIFFCVNSCEVKDSVNL
jgi:hypothetical protein